MRSDFWKFFAGQTISNLGSSFTGFAIPLLVYKLTGSALSLAGATAAYFLPYLLFGLVIGAWVDRVDRKRMMIAVDIGRALVIALIPILAYADALSIWVIYVGAFAISSLSIAFDSGQFAAVPSLVGKNELVTANGRIQASYAAASVAGPLLAGVTLAVASVEDIFLIDAASFLVSAASLALVRRSFNPEQPPEKKHLLRDVQEGLRYVLGHPVLRNISVMMAMFNFVVSTLWAQLVLFGKVRLDAGDTKIAILFAAGSAGVVVFGVSAGAIRKRLSFSVAALGALMLSGALTVVFAANTWYWAALVLWGAIQGLGLFFNINTTSLRQAIVPGHMLGRVVSIAGVLAWSAIPAGTMVGGAVIKATGDVAAVYGAIGVIVFCIAASFWFTALGRADQYLTKREEGVAEDVGLEDRGLAPDAPDLA